jgi:aminoglycoside phosphotransferase (APT) family kinase protein
VAGDRAVLRPLAAERGRAVFAAAGPGIDVVAKAYRDAPALAHEVRVLDRVRGRGVPAPEVLAFEPGPPAVVVMTRLRGRPLASAMGDAPAVEAGAALRRVHELAAAPPYSGGQHRWEEFVVWWAVREAAACERLGILSAAEAAAAASRISTARDPLAGRPTVLIHGDLQPDHVLVESGRLAGLIDFVDAQPGDGLLDVAVLTLRDEALTGPVLRGLGLAADATTRLLLDRYRLLRHLAAAAWLHERAHTAESARHAAAVRAGLAAPG